MTAAEVHDLLAAVLAGRRLLDHPFYRRWEAGTLEPDELARYAEQYRHVEDALPGVLGAVVAGLPEGTARELVAANLADEVAPPDTHLVLFDLFAGAVGAEASRPAGPSAAALVRCQREAAAAGPVPGLSALAVYEVQAAEVATTKAAGLRSRYGLEDPATRFWDVHAGLESDHGDWLCTALAALGADADEVVQAATTAARRWWEFLDERESAAPALVAG